MPSWVCTEWAHRVGTQSGCAYTWVGTRQVSECPLECAQSAEWVCVYLSGHRQVSECLLECAHRVGVRILEWAQSGCAYTWVGTEWVCVSKRVVSWVGVPRQLSECHLEWGPTARQRVGLMMGAWVRSSDGQAAGSATTVEEAWRLCIYIQ